MSKNPNATLSTLLDTENPNSLSDNDLAHLADWANHLKNTTPNSDWKRAYALIREGADLLLRRRAMSRADENTAYESERRP